MVVLCRDLVTSDISKDHLMEYIIVLHRLVSATGQSNLREIGEIVDQVVEYMLEAIDKCLPGSSWTSILLARTLGIHYIKDLSDFREAITLFDKALTSRPIRDGNDQYQFLSLSLAARLTLFRFYRYLNSV